MIRHKRILIISDIEGSSQCRDYTATKFLGRGWPEACLGMSLDVNAVVSALFNAGVQKVYIKDFHRTGYNIFPFLIDSRACLISGYKKGPVPGLGSPFDATGLIMLGMHAPSGTKGFLPHTLTSGIAKLTVNNSLLSEAELFAAILAPYNLAPLFFSGCPVACGHAKGKIPGLHTFNAPDIRSQYCEEHEVWRGRLGDHAVKSLSAAKPEPFRPKGPFQTAVAMRDGSAVARKIARRWGYACEKETIYFTAKTIEGLYMELIKTAYLTPGMARMIPAALWLYHIIGKAGLKWAGRQIKKQLPAEYFAN